MTKPLRTRELSIGEVVERSGVPHTALRFYEERGLITSTRTSGNQRRFPRDVLRRLSFIKAAQRVGLTLEEITEALSSLPDGRTPNQRDWERLSRRWTAELDERIRLLTALRDDLTSCIGCGCLSLQRCRLYNPDDGAADLGPGARYLLGDSAEEVVRRTR
ncbi:MAG TPA: redox-sensitive transcriptional activator SoxR [Acidimicrobiaceae bacterium]|nr:redox-sensitive transcriptional activator SoxR [Acidimicrobiaceae bacterium]